MLRYCSFLILVLLVSNGLFAQNVQPQKPQKGAGFVVISSNTQELIGEYINNYSITKDNGIAFPHCTEANIINTKDIGSPVRLQAKLPIIVPSEFGNKIEIISLNYDTIFTGKLAPVPALHLDNLGAVTESYIPKVSEYKKSYLNEILSLHYNGIAANVRTASIAINPIEYNPIQNEIRILKNIKFKVSFAKTQQPAYPHGSGGLSPMIQNSFVNSNVANNWKIEPNQTPQKISSIKDQPSLVLKIEIKENGLYKITSDELRNFGVDINSLDASKIAIFGSNGDDLPEEITPSSDYELNQIPTKIERNNSQVSAIYFYGNGANTWLYKEKEDSIPTHKISPFTASNFYILTIGGESNKEFTTVKNTDPATAKFDYGYSKFFNDDDKTNAIGLTQSGSGRNWFAAIQMQTDKSRPSDSRFFNSTLSYLDRSKPMYVSARVAHRSIQSGCNFKFYLNDKIIGDDIYFSSMSSDDHETVCYVNSEVMKVDANIVGSDDKATLKVEYNNNDVGTGYFDYYEMYYARKLFAENSEITFSSPMYAGNAEFDVTNLSPDLFAFDITNPAVPLVLEPTSRSNGGFSFRTNLTNDPKESKTFFITSVNNAKKVASISKAPFGNIRKSSYDADLIVITNEELKPAVQKYVDYRNSQGKYKVALFTCEDIYTEFSYGKLDPTAIRNFVGFAMKNWQHKPSYLLLCGDGTFDYRNITTKQKQFVPTYQTIDDNTHLTSTASSAFDDYFVRVVGDDNLIDLAVSRIPVDNTQDFENVLEKIKLYENKKNFGLWRNNVVLVSDDAYSEGHFSSVESFVDQTEVLWKEMPNWFDTKKIYLQDYATEQVIGRRKPAASQDLIESIQKGAVIVNFNGHGNPNVWTHEKILEKDQFIPQLKNDTMLSFVSAVTCNFGHFDDPNVVSGAEDFINRKGGGAIALLATTRAVYIQYNASLMNNYFTAMFARDPKTKEFVNVGQAMFKAKQNISSSDNDEKYIIIGDPLLRLNLPQDSVEISSINATDPSTDKVLLKGLQLVKVEGKIRNRSGEHRTDFNGTAMVTLYDADRIVTFNESVLTQTATYFGGLLFRGNCDVKNGNFNITFRIPKDISFDTTQARVHIYAFSQTEDAAGASANLRIYGLADQQITDNSGPELKLFLDDRTFRTGDLVSSQPQLIVDLKDTSGINSSGAGLGHNIEAWIDGKPTAIDLTDSYRARESGFGEGTAQKQLFNLESGEHTIKVRAWDIFNNPATASTVFRISSESDDKLAITDVVNYPNPASSETEFTFKHNQNRPINAQIDVFTLSGKKIYSTTITNISQRFVKHKWDLTDNDGAKIANGVYLYRLKISSNQTDDTYETIDKITITR